MNQKISNHHSKKVKILSWIMWGYYGFAAIFALYETITHTGFYGFLADLFLQYFGEFNEKIVFFVEFLILLVPFQLFRMYFERKGFALASLAKENPIVEKKSLSLKMVGLFFLVPALASFLIYAFLAYQAKIDENREIYAVDLSQTAVIPFEAKFLKIDGVYHGEYRYTLEKEQFSSPSDSDRKYMYAPVTSSDWNPQDPVTFVLRIDTLAGSELLYSFGGKPGVETISFEDGKAFSGTFSGVLSPINLPTYVENEFQRYGLKLENKYYVVDYEPFPEKNSFQSEHYELIPVLGAFIGFAAALGAFIVYCKERKKEKKIV